MTHDPQPATYPLQIIIDALNTATDDILDAVQPGDTGVREALNLVVNAVPTTWRKALTWTPRSKRTTSARPRRF